LLERAEVPELERCEARLDRAAAGLPRAVEIVYRHAITPTDQFRMDPGYENFQAIERGQRIAVDRDGDVGSPERGRILMPLYQGLGEDGFFIARDVSPARMQVSVALRKLGADNLLSFLPGVTVDRSRADELRVAGDRPKVLDVLRLLGYRKEQPGEGELMVTRRRQVESRKRGQGGGTERVIDDE
jgi:hypothetical protein